jgi:transmembrane sensor
VNSRNAKPTDIKGMTLDEVAANWLIRHDADRLSADEEQSFEAWRAASPAHREAYRRAEGLWTRFEEDADPAELRALRAAALSVRTPNSRWRVGIAAAASCMTAIGAIALYLSHRVGVDAVENSTRLATEDSYSTARNERSIVTLSDGTMVTLNLDTTMDVVFTPGERLVRITHGQAFFEVAKNPHRPFVVQAADRRVTALGTQFDVRLDPDRVEVVLLEGKITVDHTAPSLLEELKLRKAHVELRPGQKLVAALGEPVAISDTNAQRETSWRHGWVEFDNQTVGDAVAELNRYSERPIMVPDESVRDLRLSGVFRVGQPDRFAAIIQELLPVKVVAGEHGETLIVRPAPGDDATHPP